MKTHGTEFTQPCCTGFEAMQPSARGKEGKQFMVWVGGVSHDVQCPDYVSVNINAL